MDGSRLRTYWTAEANALLATYHQFETLLPHPRTKGAQHRGEDGRYVESLLRSYLRRFLPERIDLLTGFILRPAVKTGKTGHGRKDETDSNSSQLDIIVYDSLEYPTFQRFDDAAIVPPEGVIGLISVKKHLRDTDIKKECAALREAARLCRTRATDGTPRRGPFLALVSMSSEIEKVKTTPEEWIFSQIKDLYKEYEEQKSPYFDETIGYIGVLDDWSIFKQRPSNVADKATFVQLRHKENEGHLGLQMLLTGILSVVYDKTRSRIQRPGFTAFESGRPHDDELGSIPTRGLRDGH